MGGSAGREGFINRGVRDDGGGCGRACAPAPDRSHQAVVKRCTATTPHATASLPGITGRRSDGGGGLGAQPLGRAPAAIAHGRLYFSTDVGVLFAVNAKTGRRAWRCKSGRCVASTPAVSDSTVFQAYLYKGACTKQPKRPDGEVVAYASGFRQGALAEKECSSSGTSPLLVDGKLYVGDWNGKVWALDAASGDTRGGGGGGKRQGGPKKFGGHLYAASCDHHPPHVRDGNSLGERRFSRVSESWGRWVDAGRAPMGASASARPIARGAYGASSGKLRWSHKTGGLRLWVAHGSRTRAGARVRHQLGQALLCVRSRDRRAGVEVQGQTCRSPGSPAGMGGRVYFSTLRGSDLGTRHPHG